MIDYEQYFQDQHKHLQNDTWKEIKSKLDSILLSTNYSQQSLAEFCNSLDNMDHEKRVEAIESNWGKQFCAEKIMPLLLQLKFLEQE